MAPCDAFHFEEDDVGKAHWEIQDKRENLVSQVLLPLHLNNPLVA